jgi:glycyl-tRNA synthetase beta chain
VATSKAAKTARGESLLVELLTEELPPKSLKRLSSSFTDALADYLRDGNFIGPGEKPEEFATPRRLAVLIPNVRARQLDSVVERKGPSVQAALDPSGQPTPALLGFARSCGVEPAKLERRKDEKGEYFLYRIKKKGEPLAVHLAGYVEQAIKRLPVAKLMRWSSRDIQFVRPVHGLIMLHGSKVVPGEVLGLKSGNKTRGHRFMRRGLVTIKRATDYAKTLRTQGKVVAGYDERQTLIVRGLDKAASKLGASWRLGKEMELVDEVTSIVESPSVHVGAFDAVFLDVPRECLIVSMQHHLKHFALADGQGNLLPRFLFVANMQPRDPSQIVHGNERVLRARLADAKFFYDQDRKTRLEDRVPRLAHVVYNSKLSGKNTQRDRVDRIKLLAGHIARDLQADGVLAERAAELAKADLLTEMVGEFPELQGVMGRYYALNDGEPREVADAVEQHYRPRFAGDVLPEGVIACSVALADKFDALASMFAIGEQPSGDKDPFGLRRAALGVIRILIERGLPLSTNKLIDLAFCQLPAGAPQANHKLTLFIFDRLLFYLRDSGYSAQEVDAVASSWRDDFYKIPELLKAVRQFCKLPEAADLAAANKRIVNIVKQAGVSKTNVNASLLAEPAERELYEALQRLRPDVESRFHSEDFRGALQVLAGLKQPVDTFFDKVMVMADDAQVRDNRLALLGDLKALMNRVADISKLAA